jgi:putative inorganic carbon (hco3(-)) transporter
VVLLNCYLIYTDQWLLSLLPFGLIVAFLTIFRFDFALLTIAFCAPLSFNIEYITDGKLGLFIPTEPLLAICLVLVIAKQIIKPFIDRSILKHPIAWVIYAYLFWIVLTTITSSDVLVSVKYLLVRLWFLIPVLFLGAQLFLQKERIRLFFLALCHRYVNCYFVYVD